MNLIKLTGIDLKRLLKNEIKVLKDTKLNIKPGEIIEGEVLKQDEKFLLVNLGKKGIIRAFSNLNFNIENKKLLFKVIKTSPSVVLKILDKKYQLTQDLKSFDLKNVIKTFPNIEENLNFNNKDLQNVEKIINKLKELPQKLGLTFEKEIVENKKISFDNLKANLIETLKSTPEHHEIKQALQYIENIQKLNNDFFFFFPIFFKSQDLKKGALFYNNLQNKNEPEKQSFNIVMLLELSDNRVLQIDILILGKNVSLSFICNNKNFLNMLSEQFENLSINLKNSNFKIISTSFKMIDKLDFDKSFSNFIKIDKNENIVDIKT